MSELVTTLNKIKAHEPCAGGWRKLLGHLGKTKADDEPLSLLTILDGNGLDDALWALRSVPEHGATWRMLACDYAERALPIYEQDYPDDSRPRMAVDTARLYAKGEASLARLAAARAAAGAAAWAAGAAARSAARSAAWAAAWAAAGAAAGAAACDAACDAERQWQEGRLREVLGGSGKEGE